MATVQRKFAKGNMTIGKGSDRKKVKPGDTIELSQENMALCEHMLVPLHAAKDPEEVEVAPGKTKKG